MLKLLFGLLYAVFFLCWMSALEYEGGIWIEISFILMIIFGWMTIS